MKEFPKALYKGGSTGECVHVNNREEEDEARSKGYVSLSEEPENSEDKEAFSDVKIGESTALVDPVLTTLAAEKPEDGYIYATSGSAPTKDFPIQDNSDKVVEKTTRPVGRPAKNKE